MRALTSINVTSMSDVLILTGNGRGTGAMKVARSMYEVSVTAEYLEKNPNEADPLFGLCSCHCLAAVAPHRKGFSQ
jgi:hypothetical protein